MTPDRAAAAPSADPAVMRQLSTITGLCLLGAIGTISLVQPVLLLAFVLVVVLLVVLRSYTPTLLVRRIGLGVGLAASVAAGVLAAGTRGLSMGLLSLALVLFTLALYVRAETAATHRLVLTFAGANLLLVFLDSPATPLVLLSLATWALLVLGAVLGSRFEHQGTATSSRVEIVGRAYRPVWDALRVAALPAAFAAVCGVIAFLVLPDLNGGVDSPWSSGPGQAGGGQSGRSLQPYDGGSLSLNARGQLPPVEVARVPADSPVRWRANVLYTYDGLSWKADLPRQEWGVDGAQVAGPEQTYTVEPLLAYSSVLAPGAATSVDPQPTQIDSHNYVRTGNSPYQVTVGPYPDVHGDSAGIPGLGVDHPDYEEWLQLPSGVSERTAELARTVTADAFDDAEAARAIEEYLLSGDFRYDLDAPVAPAGQDAVDFFLFDSKAGFCEHYASASVVMLRSLGIPARIATGYAGGTETDGMRTFTGRDAHAWVEVYVPERGWVTSDPTPAAEDGLLDRLLGSDQNRRIAGFLLAGLVLTIIVIGWLRGRRGQPRSPDGPAVVRDEVALAVRRLEQACATAGLHVPRALTVHELAYLTPNVAAQLAVCERYLYAATSVPEEQVAAAVQAINAEAARLESSAVVGVT
ncbi:MAG: transglutaminaseTgpA domain-containing protein [Actinomycetales bacterium]